jgi:hypothetical protein
MIPIREIQFDVWRNSSIMVFVLKGAHKNTLLMKTHAISTHEDLHNRYVPIEWILRLPSGIFSGVIVNCKFNIG